MSTYFEDHPQRVDQYGRVRRNGADTEPQVGLHTYQAGWTAQRGAEYLCERPDYASYHGLAGLDKAIQLAPWSAETWHAIFLNNWSVGISAMWFAGRWNELSAKDRTTIINRMAWLAHRFSRWCVAQGKGPVKPVKLTRAQAMRRESGFFYHGDTQDDRSDPGADFPLAQFLAEFNRLEGNGTQPAKAPEKAPAKAPAKGSGPKPAGQGPWPEAYLTVTGSRNQYQDKALHKLLGDVGHTGTLAQRLQKHLKAKGYYSGPGATITPQSTIGPLTVQAWQRFLKDRGYYTGSITPQSQWGPQTTRATVRFLNDQAKFYH